MGVTIDGIAPGGVGYADTKEGRVYVRGTLPGDRVTIGRRSKHRGVLRADVVKHLMRRGLILPKQKGDVSFESGPNAILLSEVPVQYGQLSNLYNANSTVVPSGSTLAPSSLVRLVNPEAPVL